MESVSLLRIRLPARLPFGMHRSEKQTLDHIRRVQELLRYFTDELHERGEIHDASKLREPERGMFRQEVDTLSNVRYGSKEYADALDRLGLALRHHYEQNPHHPEHHENGIDGMTLFDIVEMLVDWKAASERHEDGDLDRSIAINMDRFGLNIQLVNILLNTARALDGK